MGGDFGETLLAFFPKGHLSHESLSNFDIHNRKALRRVEVKYKTWLKRKRAARKRRDEMGG
jgi:hypothetical protein